MRRKRRVRKGVRKLIAPYEAYTGKKVDVNAALEELANKIVPDFTARLAKAESIAQDYESLKQKLIGLLNKDQLDAAKICGCLPEVYAIECIDLWKEKIFYSHPDNVKHLAELKGYPS